MRICLSKTEVARGLLWLSEICLVCALSSVYKTRFLSADPGCLTSLLNRTGRYSAGGIACDCQNPSVDLFCCPECDTRVTSQCLDQKWNKLYREETTGFTAASSAACLVCGLPSECVVPYTLGGLQLSCLWALVSCYLWSWAGRYGSCG